MFQDQIGIHVEVYVDGMMVKSMQAAGHVAKLRETFHTLRQYKMKLNLAKCAFGVSSRKFLGFMVSQRGIKANLEKVKVVLEMQPPRTIEQLQQLTGRIAALNLFITPIWDIRKKLHSQLFKLQKSSIQDIKEILRSRSRAEY
jgi:septal ring factor EnvC (AmiA/AmiB activator)